MSMEETQLAMNIVGAPRFVLVNGKRTAPAIMLSPALGEGIMVWLANSISRRLHDANLIGSVVVSNHACVSGCAVTQAGLSDERRIENGGEASKLLLLAEAVDQILAPSRRLPNFDYGSLILKFRLAAIKNHEDGELLNYNDNTLNDIIYHELQLPLMQAVRTPSPRRGGYA